jgi:DNA-directed RNA polymerase subunit F
MMIMSVTEKNAITVAEARKILMDKAEELDPLQRRVLEYTIRFSRLDSESSKELVEELIKETQINRELAVQIVNSMPDSIPEIRTFLGRQRIIAEDTMSKILGIIKKYRVEE